MSVVEKIKALEASIEDTRKKKEAMDTANVAASKAGKEYTDAVNKTQKLHKELSEAVSELGFTLGAPSSISVAAASGE